MATATKTLETVKTVKAKRAPVAIAARAQAQLTAAVLRGKVTREELEALGRHIEKLQHFVSQN